MTRVVVAGISDLAEIARICALETGIEIVAVLDAHAAEGKYLGLPVVHALREVSGLFDAVVITDLRTVQETFDAVVEEIGPERVLAPKLLGLRTGATSGALQ
jgi:hypothetical protein